MNFNHLIHQTDEHNHPIYNKETGLPIKKSNWAQVATDRMSRKFHAKIHEGTERQPELDEDGFIKVKRREATRKPMGAYKRWEAFVDQHRQPGYSYYGMSDDGGRMEMFNDHDWEPVMTENGPAKMKAGRGRKDDTTLYLMRKPQEWYEQDQKAKVDRNDRKLVEVASDEGDDKYTPEGYAPLR